jgi:hypothetical protein
MNDIRPDLRERIEDIDKLRTKLQRRLVELQEQEERLSALLKLEEERWEAEQAILSGFVSEPDDGQGHGKYDSPLAQFVLATLREQGECSLSDLKFLARKNGISFGRKNPGRALHFLLVGMAQNGIVQRTSLRNWRLKEEGER